MNNAARNTGVQVSETMFSVLWGIYPGVELLIHMVILCFNFWETAKLFSKKAIPFYMATSNAEGFQFLFILNNTSYSPFKKL